MTIGIFEFQWIFVVITLVEVWLYKMRIDAIRCKEIERNPDKTL